MILQLVGFGLLLGGVYMLASRSDSERAKDTAGDTLPDTGQFNALYNQVGRDYNLNPALLRAVAIVESAEQTDAVSSANAVGLVQVLCTGADQDGEFCQNRFNISPWPVTKGDLKDPYLNLKLGAQILDWNLKQYGFPKGIAVYNAWSARHDPQNGPFRNQGYVDKVRAEFEALGNGHPRDGSRTVAV